MIEISLFNDFLISLFIIILRPFLSLYIYLIFRTLDLYSLELLCLEPSKMAINKWNLQYLKYR